MSSKNIIIEKLLPFINKMTFKPIEYEFDYEGDFESLDSFHILNAHLNFINLIVEVKNKIAPESKLKIGLKGFKQGSLEIQHLVDISIPVGLFALNNYDTIKNVIEITADILKLKALAGKEKVEHTEIGNNKVSVNVKGNNNTIIITQDALKQYQENPLISKYMSEASKNLGELEEVKSLELRSHDTKMPTFKLDRNNLACLNTSNPYLDDDEDSQTYKDTLLFVRKADLNPKKGKKCIWQFVHKGRDITATILDDAFIESINQGATFGKGYRFKADLKAYLKYDKSLGAFIENKKYEVIKVYEILPRAEINDEILDN